MGCGGSSCGQPGLRAPCLGTEELLPQHGQQWGERLTEGTVPLTGFTNFNVSFPPWRLQPKHNKLEPVGHKTHAGDTPAGTECQVAQNPRGTRTMSPVWQSPVPLLAQGHGPWGSRAAQAALGYPLWEGGEW